MKSIIKKNSRICVKCGGNNIKTRRVTYPLKMVGKQINIGRV